MQIMPGCRISEKIIEDDRISIFRGYWGARNEQPVLIKTLNAETADLTDLSRLVYEFEVTRKLNVQGIIKSLSLKQAGGLPGLIMEDTGVVPLKQYLHLPLSHLPTIFTVAIQLVEILRELHQNGIVHGNLKPDNIFIEPATGRVKITGFAAALVMPGEKQYSVAAGAATGTPYMSPEQTGKLNRAVDCRSDYYSLGVILYELLTGRFHLQVAEPDEWRYAHLAQKTVHPRNFNPALPAILCDIILKLIAKNPEERYQSAGGLLGDIKECRRQWTLTEEMASFPLGRMDLPGRVTIPSRLYGRREEAEVLKEALDQACAGRSGFIFVHGYTGVGKTALVNEIIKPLAVKRGYYIYGKFDQLQNKVPYAPFVQAFGNLVRQLLTESGESLQAWRKKLLFALGCSGAVMTELIPEMALIIGTPTPVEALPPQEAQNRFRWVFRSFIRVFVQKKHPLVLFIDDLQWADAASLQLIKYLSADQYSACLLLIGAYRDNEVTGAHPLRKTLAEIRRMEMRVRDISLKPLDLDDTAKYVADALSSTEETVHALTRILYRKTAGNPFFLKQLLQAVHDQKFIAFNGREGCWEWDLASLEKLELTDDVLNLLTSKLKALPEQTRDVLKVAACIGNTFNTETLACACKTTVQQAARELQPAVSQGLLLPASDIDRAFQNDGGTGDYEFLHDCVRQAAYSLLTERQKKRLHLKIGRLMLESTSGDKLDEKIPFIMEQLNRGLDLVTEPEERIRLAGYNLSAGRKAKDASAYDSSLSYLKAGIALLPENSWTEQHRLTYELYLECSQCAYLCGRLDEAERLFDLILTHARTELEKADVFGLKMVLSCGSGKNLEAVRHGFTALRQLGFNLPASPGPAAILKEVLLIKWRIRGKKIKDLQFLPEMNGPVQKKALEVMALLAPSANSLSPELFALLCLKAGNLSIKYGNSDLSSIGYAGYAIFACKGLGDYATGREFGKLAVQLVEKYDNRAAKSMVYFIVGALVSHWTGHGKIGVDYLKKAVKYGLESGALTYTGYALQCLIENMYILGYDFDEVYEECRRWHDFAGRMNLDYLMADILIYKRLLTKLQGSADAPTIGGDKGDPRDDNAILHMTDCCSQIIEAYLFGEHKHALAMAQKVQKEAYSIESFMLYGEYVFYYSLAITAAYEQLEKNEQKYYWKVLTRNRRKMKKWSDLCAANYLHKYLLIEAEKTRLKGANSEAGQLYDRAVKGARENGYIQNEALAGELAAKYYLARGRNKIARVYMIDTYYAYFRWGAVKKAESLREQHPQLFADDTGQEEPLASVKMWKKVLSAGTPGGDDFTGAPGLGIPGEEIQDLSAEEGSHHQAQRYLKLAMERAGADKGCLILEKDGELFIDAVRGNGEDEAAGIPVALKNCTNISTAVVRYVARTNEAVVLNDGDDPGIFSGDPYIGWHRFKSMLCLPVMLKGIPAGVLYLENTLLSGVFTPDKSAFLNLLSTHMVYVRKLAYLLEEDTAAEKEQKHRAPAEPLTKRELQVLRLIAAGLSNKEIARDLKLSNNTVKMHIMNIYGKLQANRRVQAVNKGKELKLI